MLPTLLFFILSCMALLGSGLLLSVGVMTKSVTLKWWSAGYLSSAIGIAAVAMAARPWPWAAYGLGPSLVLVTYGMMWVGLRRLSQQRVPFLWPVFLGLGWGLACLLPPLTGGEAKRLAIFSPIAFVYMIAIATEASKAPGRLAARIPLVILALFHAAFYIARTLCVVFVHTSWNLKLWYYITSIEAILFVFCDAFLIMNFVRSSKEEAFKKEAYTDFLTGVLTRRRFFELSEKILCNHTCSVLILDVDYFKLVNDTYGHAAGDEILCELGRICSATLRTSDLIGRIGGDEFAILIQDNQENAKAVANRIREYFRFACRQKGYEADVSIGIKEGCAVKINNLLAEADALLYQAKQIRAAQFSQANSIPERRRGTSS